MERRKSGSLAEARSRAGQKYQDWLNDPHIGELLFLTGYILYLWRSVWITTLFPLGSLMTLVCVPLSALLIGLKILFYDDYSVGKFLLLGLALLCVCLVFTASGSINPFFWLLLIAGSRKIKFEKLLKVYLAINIAIIFLAFCASSLQVIENLQYETEKRGIRNSFGVIYPTDFGAHIFFMFLAFYYLKGENLRWYHHVITISAAALVYYFCNARLDSGCTLILAILFVLGNLVTGSYYVSRNVKLLWERSWKKIGVWVMPALAFISILLTVLFQKGNSMWDQLNELVSSRLGLGKAGIEEYGWKLFGQPVDMVGFGGSLESQGEYNFVDCSYVYMMLRHGVLFLLLMIAIFALCSYKNRHDRYFLYAMALISVNCMIAHHIIQIEYNPFALALLAECARKGEGKRWEMDGLNKLRIGENGAAAISYIGRQ